MDEVGARSPVQLMVRVAVLATLAAVVWAGAGAAITYRLAAGLDGIVPILLIVTASTLTITTVQAGLEAGRRRVADTWYSRLVGGIAEMRTEQRSLIEGVGGLAALVEQTNAKVTRSYWDGYAAGVTDCSGGEVLTFPRSVTRSVTTPAG